MEAKQPAINQKLLTRSVVFLFALAACLGLYQWLKNRGADIDLGTADTKGWISAVEYVTGGTKAVVIKPDGTIVEAPGFKGSTYDRDLAWRPDGNRIFFSSDREDGAFNIYRWNLATNVVERRTLGRIAKTDPSFATGGAPDETKPLMIFSGMVWELDPAGAKASQVAPPKTTDKTEAVAMDRDENSGESMGAFGAGAQYKARQARYFMGKSWVAVIRRTDVGEVLFAQKVGSSDPKDQITIAAGDKIFMTVDPSSGRLFYSILNFQWPDQNHIPPQFIKNGVAKKPWLHMVWYFDPNGQQQGAGPITVSQDDKFCFTQPSVSPDGSKILLTVGHYNGGGDYDTRALFVMPAESNGAARAAKIYPPGKGFADFQIVNPNWSPDGHHIVFGVVSKSGDHDVCVIDSDGSNFKDLTKGRGKFGVPCYSPQ